MTGVTQDSRKVLPGYLFLAIRGGNNDGRQFVQDAVGRQAAAVALDAGRAGEPGDAQLVAAGQTTCPTVVVRDLAGQAGVIASRFLDDPSARLDVVAVTGTNGKTSCTHYVAQGLAKAGVRCGVIGTLGSGMPGAVSAPGLTTPEPVALQAKLAEFLAGGFAAVAIEASSHGLVQGRVNGTQVDVAVFTNITRDHLDYHADFAAYQEAKELLFGFDSLKAGVINIDDPFGRTLRATTRVPVITFALVDPAADVYCSDIVYARTGTTFTVHHGGNRRPVETTLLGDFNLSNWLAAFSVLLGLGHNFERTVSVMAGVTAVRGRMDPVPGPRCQVVIDYAHTPDGLAHALSAIRKHSAGSLWCVFGCGGDRDPGKRRTMGEIVARLADHTILTDDNPRTEDRLSIINDIAEGFSGTAGTLRIVPDRAEAIACALSEAESGDVVLIAGKGHETYQEINGHRLPFSDFDVVASVVARQVADDGGAG